MNDPREFPCMDDSPENNGYGYNNDLWERRPHLPDEDDYGEEDEYPRKESILSENSFTVINNGSFNCQNEE